VVNDLIDGILLNGSTATSADDFAYSAVQEAKVVINLGGRAAGRTRVPRGVLLPDRNRRAQAGNFIDLRAVYALEELAGVSRERFDVTTLAFGIESVKGQARFAGPADSGHHREAVERNANIDVPQVVLAGALYLNEVALYFLIRHGENSESTIKAIVLYWISMKVKEIRPGVAVPGGIIRVEVEGLSGVTDLRVEIGEVEAQFLGASPSALTLKVPEGASGDSLVVYQGQRRARSSLKLARLLAQELHSVANPVVDDQGFVYCAFSGARSEKVPFSIYAVDPDGNKQPFLAEIVNATGLAIGPDKLLYITSRHTGTVYRSSFDKQLEKYIEGLGLATGIVFDADGNLILGDRGGSVYRISPDRQMSLLCELEPSVSAYHLAAARDGSIFVSGPTLSTQDSIYRVSRDGQVEVFFRGLGRPQGMAFDPDGNLQVAASFRGKKGIYTFREGSPEWTISGPMLIGLAYSPAKDRLYLVDSSNLYALDLA